MQYGKAAFALPKYYGTNVSFENEPQNAIEYLMSVRREASRIPDSASVDRNSIATTITPTQIETLSIGNKFYEELDEEWMESVLNDFISLKESITKVRSDLEAKEQVFPHKNDESGWEYYCFPNRTINKEGCNSRTHLSCRIPNINELIYVDYITLHALFHYHCEWITLEDDMISKDSCLWLYALLLLIEEPLGSQAYSDIRSVVVLLYNEKNRLKGESNLCEDEKQQLRSFIDVIGVICGKYYKQCYYHSLLIKYQ